MQRACTGPAPHRMPAGSRRYERKRPPKWRALVIHPGDDRLSHKVPLAVPWALEGLTSVFGMGTGVPSGRDLFSS